MPRQSNEARGAKSDVVDLLRAAARSRRTIGYAALLSALADRGYAVTAAELGPVLREVSQEEAAAGRGMLSAVVVRGDSGRPGAGFFDLAEQLGRDTADRDVCWRAELLTVFDAYGRKP